MKRMIQWNDGSWFDPEAIEAAALCEARAGYEIEVHLRGGSTLRVTATRKEDKAQAQVALGEFVRIMSGAEKEDR